MGLFSAWTAPESTRKVAEKYVSSSSMNFGGQIYTLVSDDGFYFETTKNGFMSCPVGCEVTAAWIDANES